MTGQTKMTWDEFWAEAEKCANAQASECCELLPCPFCGGTNIDEAMVRGYKAGDMEQPIIAAGCWDCGSTGAQVKVPDHSTGYAEAAAAWNRRAR